MNLQEPTSKMSKSDENKNSTIFLNDSPEEVRNKIKRAVTDSEALVKYDVGAKPGVSNLIQLYSIATGKSFAEIEAMFDGKGYGDFKAEVADKVSEYTRPISERFKEVSGNKALLKEILSSGAEKARRVAGRTLRKVYKKVGFVSFDK